MRISACTICKNEEKNIENWIENVSKFADEIIIVDTGSTDTTKDIIAKFNIDIFYYIWNNDFAAAKNYAIEQAQGNWIVFTDADELFVTPDNVREYINKIETEAIEAVMVPIANIDTDFHDMEISRFNAIRIFRNSIDLRYFGKIHETLSHVNRQGDMGDLKLMTADEELLLQHSGYSTSIMKEKLQRNIALLNQEIEAEGLQDKHYRYLAETYYGLGDYQQAIKFSFLAIDSPVQAIGQIGDMYWLAAECAKELKYTFSDQQDLLDTAINVCPEIPDFYGLKGLLLWSVHDENAVSYLHQALQLYADKIDSNSSTHFQQIYNKVQVAVGEYLLEKSYKDEAKAVFLEVLQSNKWEEDAILGLADVYNDVGYKELLDILEEIYQYKNDTNNFALLVDVFRVNGALEIVRSLTGVNDENTVLLEEGKYEELAKKLPVKIIKELHTLFFSLLGSKLDITSYTMKKQLSLLPGNLKNIVLAYHGLIDNNVINDNLFTEYAAMLDMILLQQDDSIKEKYLLLAENFSEEHILKIAVKAKNAELWETALYLYQKISADAHFINEDFWLGAGLCFFNLDEFAAAAECMEKVLVNAKGDLYNEAQSYLMWSQEAIV